MNLLAAYRLPDNLFDCAKVTVDIVFLQKADMHVSWQKTSNIEIGKYKKPINEYFITNPDNILGELDVVKMYERMGLTCRASGILREKLKLVYLNTLALASYC